MIRSIEGYPAPECEQNEACKRGISPVDSCWQLHGTRVRVPLGGMRVEIRMDAMFPLCTPIVRGIFSSQTRRTVLQLGMGAGARTGANEGQYA